MTLQEVMDQCAPLEIQEKRSATSSYWEVVALTKDLDQWIQKLTKLMGPPLKPAGQAPTPYDKSIAQAHGGIFANQILFEKSTDQGKIIAMFWPWSDNQHVTLKLILSGAKGSQEETPPPSQPKSVQSEPESKPESIFDKILKFFKKS